MCINRVREEKETASGHYVLDKTVVQVHPIQDGTHLPSSYPSIYFYYKHSIHVHHKIPSASWS